MLTPDLDEVQETEKQWLNNLLVTINIVNDREMNIPPLGTSLNKSKMKAYIDTGVTVSLIAENLVQEQLNNSKCYPHRVQESTNYPSKNN